MSEADAATSVNVAEKLGVKNGDLIQEFGYDDDVDYDLRDWLPDHTGLWSVADVRAAQAEFEEYDGEWPEGIQRPWEPLSRIRERARGR